jgi:hypothetical protein
MKFISDIFISVLESLNSLTGSYGLSSNWRSGR